MRVVVSCLLSSLLLLAKVCAAGAAVPSLGAGAPGQTNGYCGDPQVEPTDALIDRAHHMMSQGVCQPTRWFDRFFANPDDVDVLPAGSLIRVIAAQRFQDDGERGSDLRIRGSVDLPNLEKQLSLILRNDDDIDEDFDSVSETRPQDVGNNDSNSFRAALRWAAKQRRRDNIDLELGLRSGVKIFTRARYRFNTPLPGEVWSFRFTETLTWQDGDGASAESRFEFDRALAPDMSLRFTTEAEASEELSEEDRGWQLDQRATISVRVNPRAALQYNLGVRAFTEPNSQVESYRIGIRFRQNIFRPWLFWELEPFVFWEREENFRGITGVVLRLETQYGRYHEPP